MNLLQRAFDLRQVYLGKTTKDKSRFKIGISVNLDKRWKDIDKAIPGSHERPIFSAPCLFSRKIEKSLHKRYQRYRVKQKGWGREWFQLPLLSRWYVIFIICFYSAASVLFLLVVLAGAAFFLRN